MAGGRGGAEEACREAAKEVIHYTLNTGHSRVSPRSEVSDNVIATLRPAIESPESSLGDLVPGLDDYRLVIPQMQHGLVSTVFRGQAPLVTLGVANTDVQPS